MNMCIKMDVLCLVLLGISVVIALVEERSSPCVLEVLSDKKAQKNLQATLAHLTYV